MDLSKLTPAPWRYVPGDDGGCVSNNAGYPLLLSEDNDNAVDAEFAALARNAFEVMMRRGWQPWLLNGRWHVSSQRQGFIGRWKHCGGDGLPISASDPFTALVEADQWYTEHVEEEKTLATSTESN